MNQNNNIIGYDSQMDTGYTQQQVKIPPPKKNNKALIVLSLLIIIGIVVVILYFNNQDKKELTNGNTNNETNTTYNENGAFLFSIEDVFTTTDRGTVVTGNVQRGKVKVGDTVQIIGLDQEILTTKVMGIEIFREQRDETIVGKNAGIFLKDITRAQVRRGQVLAQPNSIVAAIKFDANLHILSKEEGGKNTQFFTGYQLKFYFRNIAITGTIDLPDNIETAGPGEDVSFTVNLSSNIAMEVGTEFSIRGIGKGTVTRIYY